MLDERMRSLDRPSALPLWWKLALKWLGGAVAR